LVNEANRQKQERGVYQATLQLDVNPKKACRFRMAILTYAVRFGFMMFVKQQLLTLGVEADRIHYEIVAPHKDVCDF